jgi:hypothetical protein
MGEETSSLGGGELMTARHATQTPVSPTGDAQGRRQHDDDVHLGKATEEEMKRLATHPVQEAERLQEEIREGRSGTGLFAFVGGIAVSVWFLAALLTATVFLVAYWVAH